MGAHARHDYRIVLKGTVTQLSDDRYFGWTVSTLRGRTLLTGLGIDSPSLYGVIAALRDAGLVPLSIRQITSGAVREEEE